MMSKRVGCQVMMSKCEGRLSGYDDDISKCCREGR